MLRVLLGLCACFTACAASGTRVDLTIDTSASVSDEVLATVTSLAVHATGDETYDHVIALGRPLQRSERLAYVASAATRSVRITIDALDGRGIALASGAVGPLAIEPGTVAASVTLDLLSYRDTVLADAPVAYYRFDEASGISVADASGHGNSALYYGTIGFGAPGALADDPAIALESTDAFVETQNTAPFSFPGNAPFSVEIWLNAASVDHNYHMLFNWDEYPNQVRQHYGLFALDTNGLTFERTVDGNNVSCVAPFSGGAKWTHVVGTYDGASLRMYVNGALACTVPDARAFVADQLVLRIANGGPGWVALLADYDEAAVYATALAADRVAAHYAAAR